MTDQLNPVTSPATPSESFDSHQPLRALAEARTAPQTKEEILKQVEDDFGPQEKDPEPQVMDEVSERLMQYQEYRKNMFSGIGAVYDKAKSEVGKAKEEINKAIPPAYPPGSSPLTNLIQLGKDVWNKADRYAGQATGGAMTAVEQTWDSLIDVSSVLPSLLKKAGIDPNGYLDPSGYKIGQGGGGAEILFPPSASLDERMVRVIGQFAGPMAAWSKALNMSTNPSVMNVVKGAVAGGLSTFHAFDPDNERLASVVNEIPVLRKLVPEWMNADPNDSDIEKRVKNAIDGAVGGALADVAFVSVRAAVKWTQAKMALRAEKNIIHTPMTPEVVPPPPKPEMQTKGADLPLSPETQAAQKPYQYSPMDVTQPTGGTKVFHGTKSDITDLNMARPTDTSNPNNLFGNGVYVTDNPKVAQKYAGKNGKVISGELSDLKLLDLEKPLPENAFQVIRNNLPSGSDLEAFDKLKTQPGKDVFRAMQEEHVANETYTSDMHGVNQDISSGLQSAGYDGLRHVGGQVSGKQPHNVAIIFDDPHTLSVEGKFRPISQGPAPTQIAKQAEATVPSAAVPAVRQSAVSFTTPEQASSIATEVGKGTQGVLKPPSSKVNIDLTKMVDEGDLKLALQEVSNHFEKDFVAAKGGVRSDALVDEIGTIIGANPEDLLKRGFHTAYTDREINAFGKILRAAVADYKGKLAAAATGGLKEQTDAIIATDVMRGLYSKVVSARAESGRSLRAWQSMGELGGKDSKNAMKVLVEMFGDDIVAAAKRAEKMTDDSEIFKAFEKGPFTKLSDMMRFVQINGLLSGLHTQSKNFISNAMSTLAGPIESRIAADVSSFQNRFNPEKIQRSYMGAQYTAMMDSVSDAFRLGSESFATGESKFGLQKFSEEFTGSARLGITNSGNTYGAFGEAIKGIVSVPTRALMASDDAFKLLNYRASITKQALEHVDRIGLVGANREAQLTWLIRNPTSSMKDEASLYAHNRTFTDNLEGWVGDMESAVRKSPAKYVLPFMRTNINIIKYNLERSPFGVMLPSIQSDLKAGGVRADVATSKLAIGSMVLAYGTQLANEGTITGSGPKNRDALRIKKETGWQPNSIRDKETGKYYPFDPSDPVFNILAKAADLNDIFTAKASDPNFNWGKYAFPLIGALAEHYQPEFLIQGMGKITDLLGEGVSTKGPGIVANIAASFVPFSGAFRTHARFRDEVKRDKTVDPNLSGFDKVWGIVTNELMAMSPGHSELLPPEVNIKGEMVAPPPGYGWDVLSPFFSSKEKKDPILDELVRLGITNRILVPNETPENQNLIVTMPKRFIDLDKDIVKQRGLGMGQYKLDTKEYNQLVRYAWGLDIPEEFGGKNIPSVESVLSAQIAGGYPMAKQRYGDRQDRPVTDEMKKIVIHDIIKQYRDQAYEIFYMKHLVNSEKGIKFLMDAGKRRVEALGIQ